MTSTEGMMKDASFKEAFEEEHQKLVMSELICEMMELAKK